MCDSCPNSSKCRENFFVVFSISALKVLKKPLLKTFVSREIF